MIAEWIIITSLFFIYFKLGDIVDLLKRKKK
jgi:hypothetical protein